MAIQNVGKGTAFNIELTKILHNKSKEDIYSQEGFSDKIIPPGSEIAVKFTSENNLLKECKDLNNFQFVIGTEFVDGRRIFYRYSITDAEKGFVKYIKRSNTEKDV